MSWTANEPNTKPLRILMVEDSEDILFILKTELEWMGYVVDVAKDGTAGYETAQKTCPDIIVSDIRMPGIDGFEFIRRIRQIPALANVPAVALTGFGLGNDIKQAIARGFNVHLTKPVEPEHLAWVIEQLVMKRTLKKAS